MNAAHEPSFSPSDEASKRELQLAREQGDALAHAVSYMAHEESHGSEKPAGEYIVGYATEDAEGMYIWENGELVWQEPQEQNVHVEVVVRDGADGRFVPGLNVRATLLDSSGREIGAHVQPFLWHPWLYHYGRNWKIPGEGTYTLKIHIDPPDYPRHDKTNGRRFASPVDVEFRDIRIKTGQKRS